MMPDTSTIPRMEIDPSVGDELIAIGCAIVNKGNAELLSLTCDPDDFRDDASRLTFQAIRNMVTRGDGDGLDTTTLANEIGRMGVSVTADRLHRRFVQAVESLDSFKTHIEAIKTRALRKQLVALSENLSALATDPSMRADEVLSYLDSKVAGLSSGRKATSDPVAWLSSLESELKAFPDAATLPKVRTGIALLDESWRYILPRQVLYLIGANGSMKTSLAMSVVDRYLAESHLPIIYFSLDMTPQELALRRMSRLMDLNEHNVIRSVGTPEYEEAKQALAKEGKRLHIIGKKDAPTFRRMEECIADLKPGLVVIDYATATDDKGRPWDKLELCAQSIDTWKTRYKAAYLVQNQMSEESKANQRMGQVGTGRGFGGGAMGNCTHVGIELFQDKPDPGEHPPIIAAIFKNRNGPRGGLYRLEYFGPAMRFTGNANLADFDQQRQRKQIFTLIKPSYTGGGSLYGSKDGD